MVSNHVEKKKNKNFQREQSFSTTSKSSLIVKVVLVKTVRIIVIIVSVEKILC